MADISHDAFLRRGYFRELDGLRGTCALLVITVHLYSHKEAWAWLAGKTLPDTQRTRLRPLVRPLLAVPGMFTMLPSHWKRRGSYSMPSFPSV